MTDEKLKQATLLRSRIEGVERWLEQYKSGEAMYGRKPDRMAFQLKPQGGIDGIIGHHDADIVAACFDLAHGMMERRLNELKKQFDVL